MRQGKPEKALEFRDDVPVLEPAEGEVLVKLKSAALNPVYVSRARILVIELNDGNSGYKLMKMIPDVVAKRPLTAEYDFSGTTRFTTRPRDRS